MALAMFCVSYRPSPPLSGGAAIYMTLAHVLNCVAAAEILTLPLLLSLSSLFDSAIPSIFIFFILKWKACCAFIFPPRFFLHCNTFLFKHRYASLDLDWCRCSRRFC